MESKWITSTPTATVCWPRLRSATLDPLNQKNIPLLKFCLLFTLRYRKTTSPSWQITIFVSCPTMASYSAPELSYSSGAVKWSWWSFSAIRTAGATICPKKTWENMKKHEKTRENMRKNEKKWEKMKKHEKKWEKMRGVFILWREGENSSTTLCKRSMSTNTHSSRVQLIRKSPLKSACSPCKNQSTLWKIK